MSELYWGPEPTYPVFQPDFAGAANCRVCTVAADGYYGMDILPNLAPMQEPQYYSGALDSCKWHEDRYGISRSINLLRQYPPNFIEIAADGTSAALDAIVGGDGSTQTEQTIFIQGRKLPGSTMHALYGNYITDGRKYSSNFFVWVPQSNILTNKALFWWGGTYISATLPSAISTVTDHFWCFTCGIRGYEVWRDGYLIASTVTSASLTTSYTGSSGVIRGPAICEGYQGAKPAPLPPAPSYHSGTFSFKKLYTFDRQLEWDEINCYFNDPHGLIRPKKLWGPERIGPLNNRIEITTPVVITAEAQNLGASSVDSPVLTGAEVLMDAQSPTMSAADVVILALVEVLAEAQNPAASAVDSPVLTEAEVQMEAQSPGASAVDSPVLTEAEVLIDAQNPGASAVDSPVLAPVVVEMDIQNLSAQAIDTLAMQAVEAIFEAQAPSLVINNNMILKPVPVDLAMQVQSPSINSIVSVITKAAEVVFGMARFDISTEDDLFYTHKQAAHNAIVAAINQGVFLPVTYDPATKLMSIPEDESEAIPPASLAANELTCLFGLPERNRRDRIMERNTWRWQAIVKFHREVVLELFEEELLAAPILVAQDDTKNLRQITLHLIDADYTHPPKQSPSSGTQVVYTFEARLGPV